jgi:hypothetical protein
VGFAQDRRKPPLLRRGKLFFGTGPIVVANIVVGDAT